MSKVEISLNGRRAAIVVDGHDLAQSVAGFNLSAETRCLPTLTLHLNVRDATRIESDTTIVHMHHATHDLLVAAGWTPPAQADPTRIELNPTPEDPE